MRSASEECGVQGRGVLSGKTHICFLAETQIREGSTLNQVKLKLAANWLRLTQRQETTASLALVCYNS